MTSQSVFFSTNPYLPSVTTSMSVGLQKCWMNAPVLNFLIISSTLSLIYVRISRVLKEWKIKGLDSQRSILWMLFLNMPRSQSQSSPTPRTNHMPRRQMHTLNQTIPDMLGAVLPRRLLRQPQRKSLAWRQIMTELSRWMEFFPLKAFVTE